MADQVVRDSQKVFYPGLIFLCGVREMNKPNKYGVYPDCETINLPVKKDCKAKISIAEDTDGWRSAYSYESSLKDRREGCSSLPRLIGPVYTTRDDAIQAAINKLVERYEPFKLALLRSEFAKYLNGETSLF